jgi:hypothetical protein
MVDMSEWITLHGLPVTRPSRIASDLLFDREDPEGVAQVVADAIRGLYDYPGTFVDTLAPHAAPFGLRRGDGVALLRWLLDLAGDPETPRWMEAARAPSCRVARSGPPCAPCGLAPACAWVPAWERAPDQGVVSHRSAAALYGLGHLPADRHEFTLPTRRQTRRADVRLHPQELESGGPGG